MNLAFHVFNISVSIAINAYILLIVEIPYAMYDLKRNGING